MRTEPSRAAQPDHSGVVFPPPFVYVGFFLLGMGLQRWLPLPWPPPSPLSWGLAVLGLSGGLLLSFWALAEFRLRHTSPLPGKPTRAIVTAGPYRASRNPMYLGLALAYLGVALWLRQPWPLLLLPVVVLLVDRAIVRREERYLERKFGDEYLSYRRRVRRWL